MLKKTLAIILTITALLALSACELFLPAKTNDEVVTFDVSELTEIESEVDTTVDTTEVESLEEGATTESEVVTTVDTTEVTTEAESSSESQQNTVFVLFVCTKRRLEIYLCVDQRHDQRAVDRILGCS